jgi:glycosyltransferase involved in cell wall biosynthesis
MRVALIHDHLAQDGGAEKVLRVFSDLYPEALIYTLLAEKNATKEFSGRLRTSIIQRLPGGIKHYQWYMPFMPMAVEFFDLNDYDVVLSDASAFAKGVITSTDTLHICYCHTPTRYIWDYTHQYIQELHHNKYLKKIISLVLNYIRLWDRQAADRVDLFIANSKTVQRRIAKYYRRPSVVIYPPVDVEAFQVANTAGEYFLIGGRLAPYKRVDIVVQAFVKSGLPLKIFGDGIDLPRLRRLAGGAPNIEFLGRVDERRKAELYRRCKAFINPQEEDFGITAVEAMASGRPVIAYRKGGATETVIEGKTGLFFDKQTVESLMVTVNNFSEQTFLPSEIRQHAESYSKQRFKNEIANFITVEYQRFKDGYENSN